MHSVFRFMGQAAVYLPLAALIGYLSNSPRYDFFPMNRAQLRLAFVHGAERKEKCHILSAAEQGKLAPNMRKKLDCSRERMPIWVEFIMDEGLLFRGTLPPTGLAGDGPSKVYERFTVVPGPHHLIVRMRDSSRVQGYDYEAIGDVTLLPRQNYVIGFEKEFGGFLLGSDRRGAIRAR